MISGLRPEGVLWERKNLINMDKFGAGDLILFLFYAIAAPHYIYRYFYPFDEERAIRRYRIGMWRWRKIEERMTAGAEGRLRQDKWGHETRKQKLERLRETA